MRTYVVFLVVVFCISTACFAAPKIQVESTEIDWGTIYSGEKREHNFILHNKGDSPLIITKVRSSCGCTAAMVSNKIILPNEQAELRVRFRSKNFRGQIVKRVLVISDDPQQPQKQFILRANVIPELAVTPLRMKLKIIPAGKKIVRNLSLTNHSNRSIQINSVRSTSHHIKLGNIPTTLKPKEEIVVTLTIRPPQSSTVVLNGYILIDAQGHTHNQLRIPIVTKIIRQQP